VFRTAGVNAVLWMPEKGGTGDEVLSGGKMGRTRRGDFVKKLLGAEEAAAGAAAAAGDAGGNLNETFRGAKPTASPSYVVCTVFSLKMVL